MTCKVTFNLNVRHSNQEPITMVTRNTYMHSNRQLKPLTTMIHNYFEHEYTKLELFVIGQ